MPSSKRQRGQASPASSNRFKSRLPPSRRGPIASRSQQSRPLDSTPLSAPPSSVRRDQSSHTNAAIVSPPGNDGLQDQSADEELDQVIMAIDMKERETVGCCYYVAQEEKLYLLEDVRSGGIEIIETCMNKPLPNAGEFVADMVFVVKLDVNPTLVLASTRIDQSLDNSQTVDHGGNRDESGQ